MKTLLMPLLLVLYPVYGLHSLLVNGSESAILTTEDSLLVSAQFEVPGAIASGGFYYDLNGNDQIDAQDPVMMHIRMIDGNFDDEDELANGSYLLEDEPIPFTGQFLAYGEDNGVADTVSIMVNAVSTSYSISGTVTTPTNQAHLLVMVGYQDTITSHEYNFGDFTNSSGNYAISIPSNLGNTWWTILVLDFANVAPLYMGPFDSVYVSGHVNKNLAMVSAVPDTCTISGYVRNEFGIALAGPSRITSVTTSSTIVGFRPGYTNASGYYNIKVMGNGIWSYHSADAEIIDQYYPNYMDPVERDTILFGQTLPYYIVFDLKAYTTTNTISGHVYLDGLPYDKARIGSNSNLGESYAKSYSDGGYSVPVSDSLTELYTISVDDNSIPAGYIVLEGPQNAAAGATGIDFHLIPLAIDEIDNQSIDERIRVYPNPFKGLLYLEIADAEINAPLKIFDIAGRKIAGVDPTYQGLNTFFRISAKQLNLAQGIYFYSLNLDNKIYRGKIIRFE